MVYKIEPLDLKALFGPVTAATAAMVRLDERLARSPVRDGWIERQHFTDAAAVLWLGGRAGACRRSRPARRPHGHPHADP